MSLYSSTKISKVVTVLNQVPLHEDIWRNGGIASRFIIIYMTNKSPSNGPVIYITMEARWLTNYENSGFHGGEGLDAHLLSLYAV
jgi:hypothetical protein